MVESGADDAGGIADARLPQGASELLSDLTLLSSRQQAELRECFIGWLRRQEDISQRRQLPLQSEDCEKLSEQICQPPGERTTDPWVEAPPMPPPTGYRIGTWLAQGDEWQPPAPPESEGSPALLESHTLCVNLPGSLGAASEAPPRRNSIWGEARLMKGGTKSLSKTNSDLGANLRFKVPSEPTSQQPKPCSENSPEGAGNKGIRHKIARGKSRGKFRKARTTVREEFLIQEVREDAMAQQSTLQRVTVSRRYELFLGILILLNAIFIGSQTQFYAERAFHNAKSGQPQDFTEPIGFVVLQVLFCIAFTVELLIRWTADGFIQFFRTKEASWNVFDIIVIGFSLLDLITSAVANQEAKNNIIANNASLLRMMRVVRIVRVARVIRIMRFFRELRMMIMSILGSVKSLCWAIMVLGLLFYIFGISLTTGTIEHLNTTEKWLDDRNRNLISWFGRLDKSVVNLYMAMSGGKDWGDYYEALEGLPGTYRTLFVIFISVSILAVVNIVTGIFVDSAMQCNLTDREVIVEEELATKEKYLNNMEKVFQEMDRDSTGCITVEEFEKTLNDERVIAYFNALKLDASDARKLFMLLDFDQSGEIDINEFVSGCHKLKGESRALDLAIMQFEVRWLSEAVLNLQELVEKSIAVAARGHRGSP